MSWLVDNANSWYVLLAIAGVGFAAAWWVQRRPRLLLGAAAALGLIVLLWLLTRLVVTDRMQLQINIRAMADAVVEAKADVLLKHFANDFEFRGRKGKELADDIIRNAKQVQVFNIVISGFDLEELQERSATAFFRAAVQHRDGLYYPGCRALFVKESNQWKVKEVRLLSPLGQPVQ